MAEARRWCAQAVLFDLDGVLVDSMPVIVRLLTRWADLHGLDRAVTLSSAHGRREADLVAELAPWADTAVEVARMQKWQATEFDGCVPCPGAQRLLTALGDCRWAVVTSGSRAVALGRLRAAGLPVPATLVSADDVVHGKPHPEPYLKAAAALGVRPTECVVVEDAPSGVASGLDAGMRVIAVAPGPEELRGAHAQVASLADIDGFQDAEREIRLTLGGARDSTASHLQPEG
ncbi:HAD-IA family hydrolase [Streptomyces sp. NPDC059627]